MNVNFKIMGIDVAGTNVYVKFWADGAEDEVFKQHLGPYTIYLDPIVESMNDEEFYQWIARWGYQIVKRQKDSLDSIANGTVSRFESMIGNEYKVNVDENV